MAVPIPFEMFNLISSTFAFHIYISFESISIQITISIQIPISGNCFEDNWKYFMVSKLYKFLAFRSNNYNRKYTHAQIVCDGLIAKSVQCSFVDINYQFGIMVLTMVSSLSSCIRHKRSPTTAVIRLINYLE